MSPQPFKAQAYLKEGCPFSFKFWLFMIEAGLSEQIEVIRCDPDDAAFEAVKAKLSASMRTSLPRSRSTRKRFSRS